MPRPWLIDAIRQSAFEPGSFDVGAILQGVQNAFDQLFSALAGIFSPTSAPPANDPDEAPAPDPPLPAAETTEGQPVVENTAGPTAGAAETSPPQDDKGAEAPGSATDAAAPTDGAVEQPDTDSRESEPDPMPTATPALAAVGQAFTSAFASLSDLLSSISLLPVLNQPISDGMLINSHIAMYQSLQLPPADNEEPEPGATDEAGAEAENGLLLEADAPTAQIDFTA